MVSERADPVDEEEDVSDDLVGKEYGDNDTDEIEDDTDEDIDGWLDEDDEDEN